MAHNTRPLKRAQDGVAPQYYNRTVDEYEVLEGTAGANHVVIYGPDGQPISSVNRLPVEVAQGRLYGYDGTTWRPVKVTADGELTLAADVTINTEGLVIDVGEELDLADRPDRELGKVTVSGKKASVAYGDYGQTLSVAAGNSTVITIRPPVGELWRIRLLRVLIPAPEGATTGTHRLDTCLHSAQLPLMVLIEPYNRSLQIVRNHMPSTTATTKEPADPTTQVRVITSLVCTNSVPLVLYYHNYSDAAQTGEAIIRVVREVEYINA